jgi:RNA polymerase sigma-70 factor (ECF subfamily)
MVASSLTQTLVESKTQTDPRTDQQLVAAINAGDAAAFEVLYYRYRDWVVNLSYRFTGNEDLALDVLQETFLYLLRKFPGFRLTAHIKTFLYPAVRHLSIAARQKAGRYQSTNAEQEALECAVAEGPAAPSTDLAAALENLTNEHREVLLLRFVDGLALQEIADAIDVPLGTVKSRLHNALESLRHDERAKEFFDR